MPTPVELDKVRSSVRQYILSQFLPGEDPASLTDSTPLITGGILDSIGSVKLVSYLEENFGVRFEAHEVSMDHLDTVDLVVGTLAEKLERQ
jgi:acyl carrier protein